MWNKENTIRLFRIVTNEYGKEIIEEGSRAVLGLETHIDEMIAKVMGVEREIITVAREWRKIIERATMTEGIDKVKLVLQQKELIELKKSVEKETNEDNESTAKTSSMEIVEEDITTKEIKMIVEETQAKVKKDPKEEPQLMEGIKIEQGLAKEVIMKDENKKIIKQEYEIIEEKPKATLEESIWAPSKDKCEEEGIIEAKVAAIKVLGDSAVHREKSLRWSIGKNPHIKNISERYDKGNLWCIITFDCRKGYEEARQKLENKKEEHEQMKLILTEDRTKKENSIRVPKLLREDTAEGLEKERRKNEAKKELEEIYIQRSSGVKSKMNKGYDIENKEETKDSQEDERNEQEEVNNKITVWDLPEWAKRVQVFETVRFMGRVEYIEMIKGPYGKTKAEVEFKKGTFDKERRKEIWCLPFANKLLVRITVGTNNYKILQTRNRYSRRLLDLPDNTSEVLLWRQIRRTGAKAIHVFKNSNKNNMGSATVYFENEEDLTNSTRFAMYYYNSRLRWATKENVEAEMKKNRKNLNNYMTSSNWQEGSRQEENNTKYIRRAYEKEEMSIERENSKERRIQDSKTRHKDKGKNREDPQEESSRSQKERFIRNLLDGDPNESIQYIAQLMQGLKEKVDILGLEVPNRS